jgi:hypothetical protein
MRVVKEQANAASTNSGLRRNIGYDHSGQGTWQNKKDTGSTLCAAAI